MRSEGRIRIVKYLAFPPRNHSVLWAYAEFRSYPSDKPCPEFEVNYISTLVNTTHVHKKRDIRAVLGPNNMAFKSLSLWEN